MVPLKLIASYLNYPSDNCASDKNRNLTILWKQLQFWHTFSSLVISTGERL